MLEENFISNNSNIPLNINIDIKKSAIQSEVINPDIPSKIYKTEEATNFLKFRPYLNKLLYQVIEKADKYFNNPKLYLRLIYEPDFDEEELLLSIVTEKTPEEALEILKRFDDEWWIDFSHLYGNKLNIDVMPV